MISNFEYLADVLIPSMLDQLEVAFGISLMQDRQVSKMAVIARYELNSARLIIPVPRH